MVLLGAGAGTCFPALMTLAMSGADAERRRPGLRPGQHDGAGRRRARPRGPGDAVVPRSDDLLAQGSSQAEALTGGYHLAFWIAAALIVASIIVGLVVVEPPERAAEHVAQDAESATACAEAA